MTIETGIPLMDRARGYGSRTAVVASEGVFTYDDLLRAAAGTAERLLRGREDLGEMRAAFLCPPGFRYVSALWGIWSAGGVAVPLAVSHPRPELEHVVDDSDAEVLLCSEELVERLRPIAQSRGLPLLTVDADRTGSGIRLPRLDRDRRAMIVYTSGTTGRPKGVVTTHGQIEAQITMLVSAWGWTRDDRILDVLPLHHVHGIVNILLCALWSAAVCEIMPRFDPDAVWERLGSGELTLFMAVPTIYTRLISAWRSYPAARGERLAAAASRMRLMVSGSAALPVTVLEEWRRITGHVLLERYGMTEIGMALSNPLHDERIPGHVGRPLPGVRVRLVDESGAVIDREGEAGELQVKGPGVFLEYWRKPEETAESFSDGWFRTGDVAVVEDGSYRILGRKSTDIIKTGGYKVSALEIEEVLLRHPEIAQCAVVGLPDEEWGQRVAAAIVPEPGRSPDPARVKEWAKELLAPYKVPSRWLVTDELPRNAVGKVMKPRVLRMFR